MLYIGKLYRLTLSPLFDGYFPVIKADLDLIQNRQYNNSTRIIIISF